MTAEVTIGPPVLSINRSSTFMVTDLRGDILADREQGVFASDTRFVSEYRLFIEQKPWQLLTSAAVHHYAAQLQLVNPAVATQEGDIHAHNLGLSVARLVEDGIHEDLPPSPVAR